MLDLCTSITILREFYKTYECGRNSAIIQIQVLELQKEKFVEQLEQIRIKETEVAKELSQKYGNGSIDLEKGIFIK